MGAGLERLLSDEAGVVVDAVDVTSVAAVEAALANHPVVVVVEEGGGIDAVDVARRSSCALVLDVDITTTRAWTLRRESLSTQPDEFLATIRSAVAGRSDEETAAPCRGRRGKASGRSLRQAAIPG